jgi:protein-tyrosine-phosphatase
MKTVPECLPVPDPSARLLFVCTENSNRSQMAEGFARALGGAAVHAESAGSRPSGSVNPRAIRFMAERDIDLTGHRSKGLDEVSADSSWDAVVTMGCGDACPHVPARLREDWDLPDPKSLDDQGFRSVRDEIERRVRSLLGRLGVPLLTQAGE